MSCLMRHNGIYICAWFMKTRQMMMINSLYLDEPLMSDNGLSCIHVGDVDVYFGIL